ncbi:MAG: hypothetical protein IKA72_00565, partial [Clostridia bacterium]|nr:hypothetical protein [Clostridia bacterium]
ASLEIVQKASVMQVQTQPTRRRVVPAPVGAAPQQLSIEEIERRKEKRREYNRRYYQKHKAQK